MTRGSGETIGVGVFDSRHGMIRYMIHSTTHHLAGSAAHTIRRCTADGGRRRMIRIGDGTPAMDTVRGAGIPAVAADVQMKRVQLV